jgi:acyl carrier protein
MDRVDVLQRLRQYMAWEVLNGQDIGLDDSTPLLAWRVLNSLELVRLLSFIHDEFHIRIPFDLVVAEHFRDLKAIADLVVSLAEQRRTAPQSS